MTGKQPSRPRSRLAQLAMLAIAPLVLATVGGVIHASPASAATRAQVLHLMDANGAAVVDRSDHGGDHHSDHGDRGGDHHSDRGDHGDRHHDEGGDRHHDEGGDHHGAECHNCGIDNGDHREGGGEGDHGDRDHHRGGHDHDCEGGLGCFLVEGAEALAKLLGGGRD
jgi:hypothetical protein